MDVLSFVHVKKLTPAPAVLFHALVAFGMVVSGSIEGLIDFFSFTVWIFYGMSMAALLVGSVKFQAVRTHQLPREPIFSFAGSTITKISKFSM